MGRPTLAVVAADADEAISQQLPAAKLVPLMVRRLVAARLNGVSPASWDRLTAAGKTPKPIRLGGALLWNLDELKRWTAAGCPERSIWLAMQETNGRK